MTGVDRARLIAALAALLFAVSGTHLTLADRPAAERSHDDDDSPSRRQTLGGQSVLKLTEEEQQYSGVVTLLLTAEAYLPEQKAYGKVLDIRPLLELRTEYEAARSDRAIFEAELKASSKEYERLRKLHEQGKVIAENQVYDAEALYRSDIAQLDSAKIRLRDTRDKTIQEWGRALSVMALDDDVGSLDHFIAHEEMFLLVTLMPDQSLPEQTQIVYVDRNGDRARARPALFVSEAPGTDAARQGESYIFRTSGKGLRTGMRLDVWIPQRQEPLHGVNLPRDSIVWYAGKPWVYVKIDAEHFTRREVLAGSERQHGWFVQDNFNPGEQIVVSGGQMLLSEEFRWQIPEEDTTDDDD